MNPAAKRCPGVTSDQERHSPHPARASNPLATSETHPPSPKAWSHSEAAPPKTPRKTAPSRVSRTVIM